MARMRYCLRIARAKLRLRTLISGLTSVVLHGRCWKYNGYLRESGSGKSTRLASFGAMMSTVAQSSSIVTSMTLLLALCAATLVSYHKTLRCSMHQSDTTFSMRNLKRHLIRLQRCVKQPAFTNAF